MGKFLVYEHWRPDTDRCFYVGKGTPKRSRSFEARNSRYGRIVAKLARLGMRPEIKIVMAGLSEDQAHSLEIKTIAERRAQGVQIANYTDGGDGTAGRVYSEDTKAKLRAKATGRRHSLETRAKMAVARVGRKHSAEVIEKMRESARVAQAARAKREIAEFGAAAMSEKMRRLALCKPVIKGFS